MANKRLAIAAIPLGLLIALSMGSAFAAQKKTAARTTELQTVTVVAPRITYQVKREGGSVIPKEVTVAKKTALVSYADLNLNRTADLYILEDRINRAADQVCRDLAQEFPDGEPNVGICARRAAEDALAYLRQMTREQVAVRP